ncbi:MAG: ABC transporter ATP-binding protein [Myxococcales bacterium]|jgi:subfamily B ATP-binding cassette protein MsbA
MHPMVGRLLRYHAAEAKTLLAAGLCMVLLALTTGAYAWLMGPMVQFLVTGGADGLGKAFELVPALRGIDRSQALVVLPAIIVGVGLIKGAAYLGQFYMMGMLGQRIVARVRRELLEALLAQDAAFFGAARTGDLLSRFTADVAQVERAATYAIAFTVRGVLSLVVLLGLALWLDWKLSLVAFVGVPVVAVPIAKLAKKLKRRSSQGQESMGRLMALVQEGLWGVRVIQAYRMERRELKRFDAENARCLHALVKVAKARSIAPALTEIASVAGLALVLKLAADAVVAGAADPAKLITFLAIVVLVYEPVRELGKVGQMVIAALASAERIFAVVDRQPAIRELPGAALIAPLEQELKLDAVRFAYRDKPVLDGCTIELKKGEVVALVGESGAGKSTAALLAMRFADPQQGEVRFDGVPARGATLSSVRRQFGLVTQEPLLFSGTVAENIGYGREGATREEIEWAAGIADADGFIRALPQGYETRIGERGTRLSGGQKQRVALARALLAKAPVLLLDEATSNLDAESEREVTRALGAALRDRTALVIAHRLSTIRNAHQIAVIKEGRVFEQGTHEALLAADGEYARLYRRQAEEG